MTAAPGQNYTPMVGDTLTWLNAPRPAYTRRQRVLECYGHNLRVELTDFTGYVLETECTVEGWLEDVAHPASWRLDAPRAVETPAGGVGALAAAYADAKRAMEALGTSLKDYGADPGLHQTGLTWEYDGYFTWDGGDGYVSDDGLTLPYQSTVLWDEPHMADGPAYRAWVAAEEAKRVAAGRERDEERVRLALRRLYGEAGVAALDALARAS